MPRPLFLSGMMGCGKTTVGRVLALAQGVPLVDLDERIERLFFATVPELVATHGEPGFRTLESRALASLVAEPGFCERGVVVALGGGAVLDEGNRRAIDHAGPRVYLEVSVEELVRRLRPTVEADPDARPLLQPPLEPLLEEGGHGGGSLRLRVAELLAARGSSYRAGALCIDAHGDPAVVAARVMAALDERAVALDDREATGAGRAPEPAPAADCEAV